MKSKILYVIIILMIPFALVAAEEVLDLDEMDHVELDCILDERSVSKELPSRLECTNSHTRLQNEAIKIYVRLGADVKNALVGSPPTNNEPSLDLYVALPISARVLGVSNVQFTPSHESFQRIGYKRTALEIGKSFEWNRFTYTPGIEGGMIERTKFGKFYNYGINNTFQYKLGRAMELGLIVQTQNREDLNQVYGLKDGKYPRIRVSSFLYITVKLN